jgi:hypothetical protein
LAGGKGNFWSNAILSLLFGQQSPSAIGTLYFALYTAAPTDAGGGTEVSGGSYARVSVTNNTTNFPTASSQQSQNANLINFGTASANWGTIVAVGVFDASTSGNLLYWGPLTVNKTINSGDSFKIAANNATFTES